MVGVRRVDSDSAEYRRAEHVDQRARTLARESRHIVFLGPGDTISRAADRLLSSVSCELRTRRQQNVAGGERGILPGPSAPRQWQTQKRTERTQCGPTSGLSS